MNCPICGRPLLVADSCAYCESCRRTFQLQELCLPCISRNQEIVIPAGRIAAAIGAGVIGSILTSFMTQSFPLKTDPPEVKMEKTSRIVAGAVAGGFIGLLFTMLSP